MSEHLAESSPLGEDHRAPKPGADNLHEPVADDLFMMIYSQLRALAQQQMASEHAGHTLSATALVHEAYIRLAEPRQVGWQSSAHFYAAAAQAMRRLLIDHARAKGARGGRPVRVTDLPDVATLAEQDPETILAVDAAVARLESEDPEAAAIVRLRFFAGLSVDQAANALGTSPRSAARLWTFARATLHRMLREDLKV